jgi:molecular chaperone DnaK (HSP70)
MSAQSFSHLFHNRSALTGRIRNIWQRSGRAGLPKKDMRMLLGIDYGTTRTVVATVDRGNYPLVSFQTASGDPCDWYPSTIAAHDSELAFGFEAAARQGDPAWTLWRSFKRELSTPGPDERVSIGACEIGALELLTKLLAQLRSDLLGRSNLRARARQKLEAMISVPANANSNQRFITIEAFRRAGFEVRGLLNEPSAAGIEYAHYAQGGNLSSRRENLIVYDLGGGTFDTSVISIAAREHEVISSEGIARLGGDDFDRLLLALALETAGIADAPESARTLLLEECREKKEGLSPNTRRLAIELERGLPGAGEVIVSTADFYEQCRPLVERTIESVEHLMKQAGIGLSEAAAIYLVGGSSDLPIVARTLRERYGRLVRRSPYPHAAVAIGLAIAADSEAGYKLRERFTRNFGVWRETDDGRRISFDVLFGKDTALPARGEPPLIRTRRYHPAHNIGHFRYLECGNLDAANEPRGELTPWNEILFPFDPALRESDELEEQSVRRSFHSHHQIEEVYSCDANGIIEVAIQDLTNCFGRHFRLRGPR